jgi:signal transduction histidine kinase
MIMSNASELQQEDLRLKDLQSYGILDSAPEVSFDQLCELARTLCGTPIAFISFIDSARQWFKSMLGLEGFLDTPREISFCTHTIQGTKILMIEDATQDLRFSQNPFVKGPPNIKFYAGTPLISPQGHAFGTLSVVDTKVNSLTTVQISMLKILAGQVVELLELHKAKKVLETQQDIVVNKARLQSIGELAGGVCHQINNPLAVIVGRSMMLRSKLKQHFPESLDFLNELDVIDKTSYRISSILKALRMYAKDMGEDVTESSLHEIIEDALTLLHSKFLSFEIESTYKVGADFKVSINRNQIFQVILDVLHNTIEAMEDVETRKIFIELKESGKTVSIIISDTGQGVSPENKIKIFSPFFSTKAHHFGVGLSNAQNFLMQNQGKISLTSLKDPTTFTILLPKSVSPV